MRAVKPDPDPVWGAPRPQVLGDSTGVRLNGFFASPRLTAPSASAEHLHGWPGREHWPAPISQRATRPVHEGPQKMNGLGVVTNRSLSESWRQACAGL